MYAATSRGRERKPGKGSDLLEPLITEIEKFLAQSDLPSDVAAMAETARARLGARGRRSFHEVKAEVFGEWRDALIQRRLDTNGGIKARVNRGVNDVKELRRLHSGQEPETIIDWGMETLCGLLSMDVFPGRAWELSERAEMADLEQIFERPSDRGWPPYSREAFYARCTGSEPVDRILDLSLRTAALLDKDQSFKEYFERIFKRRREMQEGGHTELLEPLGDQEECLIFLFELGYPDQDNPNPDLALELVKSGPTVAALKRLRNLQEREENPLVRNRMKVDFYAALCRGISPDQAISDIVDSYSGDPTNTTYDRTRSGSSAPKSRPRGAGYE